MPMALRIEADTDGGDDAEALATVLEQMAAKIREAGGDPLWLEDEQTVTHCQGEQDVYYFLQVLLPSGVLLVSQRSCRRSGSGKVGSARRSLG